MVRQGECNSDQAPARSSSAKRGSAEKVVRLGEDVSNQLFKTLEDWNHCLSDTSLGPKPY